LSSTKLTDSFAWCLRLNPGNPTRGPLRVPCVDADQLASAAAQELIPDRKACIDTSDHHGATSAFTAFQRRLRAYAAHDSAGVNWSAGTPAARSAARVARLPVTSPSAQLNASRALPQ
jgi:hypothetical protein